MHEFSSSTEAMAWRSSPKREPGPQARFRIPTDERGDQPPSSPYWPSFQTYMTYSGFFTSPFSSKDSAPSTVS